MHRARNRPIEKSTKRFGPTSTSLVTALHSSARVDATPEWAPFLLTDSTEPCAGQKQPADITLVNMSYLWIYQLERNFFISTFCFWYPKILIKQCHNRVCINRALAHAFGALWSTGPETNYLLPPKQYDSSPLMHTLVWPVSIKVYLWKDRQCWTTEKIRCF